MPYTADTPHPRPLRPIRCRTARHPAPWKDVRTQTRLCLDPSAELPFSRPDPIATHPGRDTGSVAPLRTGANGKWMLIEIPRAISATMDKCQPRLCSCKGRAAAQDHRLHGTSSRPLQGVTRLLRASSPGRCFEFRSPAQLLDRDQTQARERWHRRTDGATHPLDPVSSDGLSKAASAGSRMASSRRTRTWRQRGYSSTLESGGLPHQSPGKADKLSL